MYLHFDGPLTGNIRLAMALAKQCYPYCQQLYYAPQAPADMPAFVQFVQSKIEHAGYHGLDAFGGLYLPEGVFPIAEWEPLTMLGMDALPAGIAVLRNAYHVAIRHAPLFAKKNSTFVQALLLQAKQGKAMHATKREARLHGIELIPPGKLVAIDNWAKQGELSLGKAYFASLGEQTNVNLSPDSKGQQLIRWLITDVLQDKGYLL